MIPLDLSVRQQNVQQSIQESVIILAVQKQNASSRTPSVLTTHTCVLTTPTPTPSAPVSTPVSTSTASLLTTPGNSSQHSHSSQPVNNENCSEAAPSNVAEECNDGTSDDCFFLSQHSHSSQPVNNENCSKAEAAQSNMAEEFNDDFSDGHTYVPPDPQVISSDSDDSLISISTISTSKSYNVSKGNYFLYEQLASLTPENVEKLPHDIDGDKVYKIKTSEENWVKTLQDG